MDFDIYRRQGFEKAKIVCGRAHFKASESGENPARYVWNVR